MGEHHEGLKTALKAFAILSGIGFYFIAFIGIFLFLGSLADDFLGTGNAMKITCLFLSFPVSFYCLYRRLKSSGLL